jgi:branched-subunit amino acid transport protein
MSVTWMIWSTIVLAGLVTYGIRLSFILLFANHDIPSWLSSGLRFVPPAVLSAIIFPELLIKDGSLELTLTNLRLIAGLAAILVAWKTKSVIITILVGMGLLWILQIVIK